MPLSPPDSLCEGAYLIEREVTPSRLEELWLAAEPRRYARKVLPACLAIILLHAFCARLSGLRAILACHGERLRTQSLGTLSAALSLPRFAVFLRLIAEDLERRLPSWETFGERVLVAIDTTWFSLPRTQRTRGLRLLASDAVGLGAMVAVCLDPCAGAGAVRLLTLLNGAHNDTLPVRAARLIARGPTYLFDRGYYSMQTVAHWLKEGIRFIVRAKTAHLRYTVLRPLAMPSRRLAGGLVLLEDAIVRLGSPRSRAPRSSVRLLRARRASDGEVFVLLTGHEHWTASEVFAAYRRRLEVEDFFLFLKEEFGLAHLYGLSAPAIEGLVRLALLSAGLLLAVEETIPRAIEGNSGGKKNKPRHTVTTRLRRGLAHVRRELGIPPRWRPNTSRRPPERKRKRTPRQQNPQPRMLTNH